MQSTIKKLFLFILFLFQFFATLWFNAVRRLAKSKQIKHDIVKLLTSTAPNNKLLGKNTSQIVGDYLDPDSVQKMRRSCKQWSDVSVYENIAPNEHEMALFKHKNTNEIIWEASAYKNNLFWRTTIPNQEKLVNVLRRNHKKKWNAVFKWVVDNFYNTFFFPGGHPYAMRKSKENVSIFLKQVMLAISENIHTDYVDFNFALNYVSHFGFFNTIPLNNADSIRPLLLASIMDDTDSILKLVKRGANVNHPFGTFERYPLHFAAIHGNVNACIALLTNDANINVRSLLYRTPLMMAAYKGNENVLKLLLEREADRALTDAEGKTALQIALKFKRSKCVAILQQ